MSSSSSARPPTSAPRGICRYYNAQPRGCTAGARCKFLHGADAPLTPADAAKRCRYFAAGYCKHGADCWFLHDAPPDGSGAVPDDVCGICLETPVTYGLLSGCSHVFCVGCVRAWRDTKSADDGGAGGGAHANKRCPYCRTLSDLVVPSSHYFPCGHPGKAAAAARFRASTARVPCRHFAASPPGDRFCPFGRDCLYKHENADGTPHVFAGGKEQYMPLKAMRARRPNTRATLPALMANEDSPLRDNLNSFFRDVRAVLGGFYRAAAAGGTEDAPAGDATPAVAEHAATEHLLDVLAGELAMAHYRWDGDGDNDNDNDGASDGSGADEPPPLEPINGGSSPPQFNHAPPSPVHSYPASPSMPALAPSPPDSPPPFLLHAPRPPDEYAAAPQAARRGEQAQLLAAAARNARIAQEAEPMTPFEWARVRRSLERARPPRPAGASSLAEQFFAAGQYFAALAAEGAGTAVPEAVEDPEDEDEDETQIPGLGHADVVAPRADDAPVAGPSTPAAADHEHDTEADAPYIRANMAGLLSPPNDGMTAATLRAYLNDDASRTAALRAIMSEDEDVAADPPALAAPDSPRADTPTPEDSPTPGPATPPSSPRPEPVPEPPFMTDGRGRVVWSRAGAKRGAPDAPAPALASASVPAPADAPAPSSTSASADSPAPSQSSS